MRLDTLDAEHRLYLTLLALASVIFLLNPGMAILTQPDSWSAKVAGTTIYPKLIGVVFLFCAAALVPSIFCMASARCNQRGLLKLGAFGAGMGGFAAFGIGYLSRLMDLGWFSLFYLAVGVFNLLIAGVLAAILNQQMKLRCHA